MSKEKHYLKSAKRAIIHGFHSGDFAAADAIEERNFRIMSDLYKRLQYGLIDCFYINSGKAKNGNLYLFTRDTVYSDGCFGAVRVSVFWRKGSGVDVEFIPLSHHTFNTLVDFKNYNFLPCGWVYVGADWRYKMGVA